MFRNCLLIILILSPQLLFAQINESDSLDIQADLAITGFLQKGNVQTFIFRTSSNISARFFHNLVFKTQNSYVYQEFGTVKADEDILSLNFLYLNPDKEIYPLALAFVSTNFRREIEARYLFGAGASFQVFEKEKNWLKLSVTTEYERTKFKKANFNKPEYDGKFTINAMRTTLWINGSYGVFNRNLIVTHESYYQPSLQDSENYRWRADIGFEFPIWNHLNIKINYLQTFESIVINGQKRRDQFFTFGFNLKSY